MIDDVDRADRVASIHSRYKIMRSKKVPGVPREILMLISCKLEHCDTGKCVFQLVKRLLECDTKEVVRLELKFMKWMVDNRVGI